MQKFTGTQYLKIDIASNFGLDKELWDNRLAWFDINEPNLEDLIPQASEPALYFAGVQAYRATQRGEPTGYMISLDATSSGLQLLAALTGDRKAARLCNVVNTNNREDAYTLIYQIMLGFLGESAKIKREDIKQAIMTSLYSSRAVPKKVFGEGGLLDLFYSTMNDMAPAAWELNEAMLSFWNPEALSHDWVMPDNFHVHIKVMNQVKEKVQFLNEPFDVFYNVNAPMEEGRSLGANSTHSIDGMIVREMSRRCGYNPSKVMELQNIMMFEKTGASSVTKDDELVLTLWGHYQNSGYLSARILDHLNADNLGHVDHAVIQDLIDSLPKKPFEVISIHDCFRCHPNYGNDLRIQYNLQLQMIAKSNLLAFLISQILGRKVEIGKLDANLYKDVMDSDYALS